MRAASRATDKHTAKLRGRHIWLATAAVAGAAALLCVFGLALSRVPTLATHLLSELLFAAGVFSFSAIPLIPPIAFTARRFASLNRTRTLITGAVMGALAGVVYLILEALLDGVVSGASITFAGVLSAFGALLGCLYAAVFWLTIRRLAPGDFTDPQ